MFPNLRLVMVALVSTLGLAIAFAFVSVRVAHDTIVPRPLQPPSVFQQTMLSASDLSFEPTAFDQPAPRIAAIPYAEEPRPSDFGFGIVPDARVAAVPPAPAEDVAAPLVAEPTVPEPKIAEPALPTPPAPSVATNSIATTGIATPGAATPDTTMTRAAADGDTAQVAALQDTATHVPADQGTTAQDKTAQDNAATVSLPDPSPSAARTDSAVAQDVAEERVVASLQHDARTGEDALDHANLDHAGVDNAGSDVTGPGMAVPEMAADQSRDARPVRLPIPNPKFAALLNAAAKESADVNATPSDIAPKTAKSTSKSAAKPAKKAKKPVAQARPTPPPPPAPASNQPYYLFGN